MSSAATLRTGAVYSLLGAMAALIVPHTPRLPDWLMLTVLAFLLWQSLATALRWKPLSRWLLAGMSVAATAAVVISFGPVPDREGSVVLLVLMAGLKCLELRSVRDAHVATLLGHFLIVTHFLYSQTALLAAFLALILLWLVATGVAFQDRNRTLPPVRILRTAAVIAGSALPLAALLFLLFPRVQGPLFGDAATPGRATTGLGDAMSPGDIVDLGLSDEVAFRVDFDAVGVGAHEMYWRGPVLWDFDGRTWRAGRRANPPATVRAGRRETGYRVTLEPHGRRWMFALDVPAAAPAGAVLGADLLLRAQHPIRTRTRYVVRSLLDYRVGLEESEHVLRRALRLPPDANPRTVALGTLLRTRSGDGHGVLAEVLSMFRQQPFHYTLAPPALGRDSVDEFLFDTRRGFCEHYASAFAVIMRAAGVPARIVTGYQGGEYNNVGNYLVVRQSHAHAWVEVWLPDQGWRRVDPTAAVAPGRVETGSALPWRDQDASRARDTGGWPYWIDARQVLDHLTRSWNDWVLDYSAERQRGLLRYVGLSDAGWPRLAALLAAAVAPAVAALAALRLRHRPALRADRVDRAYARFCSKLERVGCARRPHEGPYDFARRIAMTRPALSVPVDQITLAYVGLRYAHAAPVSAAGLEALVRAFAPRRVLRQSGARY